MDAPAEVKVEVKSSDIQQFGIFMVMPANMLPADRKATGVVVDSGSTFEILPTPVVPEGSVLVYCNFAAGT